MHQDWGKQLREAYRQLFVAEQSASKHEISLDLGEPGKRVLELSLSLIRDHHNARIGVALFVRDITERKVTEKILEDMRQDLERMSFEDGLTGIANRRMFDKILSQEWYRMQRHGLPLSIVMIDVDFFKLYNDHYGHQAGDDCLKQVAQALRHQIARSSDLVARYGGEEFVVLLPETNLEDAYQLAQNCAAAVLALNILHEHSPVAQQVSISGGGVFSDSLRRDRSKAIVTACG